MRKNPEKQRMTKGQWAVHRERGQVKSFRQPPVGFNDRGLSDGIESLLKGMGLKENLWIEELSRDWEHIVGKGVGKHTKPGRVVGSMLYVFVDSSVWLNELKRFGQKEMLSNLQKRFGAKRIKSITLQLNPD